MDITYFESGYIEDGYFAYTANAIALEVSSASMTASVGVIKSSAVELVVTTSVEVSVYHLEGAELFAFSDAALAAEVGRIRSGNIQATASFSTAIDAVRGIYVSAQADSRVELTVANLRVRNIEAASAAAFSLTCTAIRAIRISASSQVQGQIIAQTGSILQTDLYPNYSQVTLSQPE